MVAGQCDAFTMDMSATVAKKYVLEADNTCGVEAEDPDGCDACGSPLSSSRRSLLQLQYATTMTTGRMSSSGSGSEW